MSNEVIVSFILMVLGIGIGYNLHAMAYERIRMGQEPQRRNRKKP